MHSSRFQILVNQALKEVSEISIADLHRATQEKESFILIDVREDHEWAMGYIPQAIHLSKGIIERDIERTVPDLDTPLVLYCGGGYRSALSGKSLQDMGYTQVLSLQGGIKGWQTAGLRLDLP